MTRRLETRPAREETESRRAHPLLVVRLRGDQAEMGAQHGRILRSVGGYEAPIDYYPTLPERILLSGHKTGGILKKVIRTGCRTAVEFLSRWLERKRPAAYRKRDRAFMRALGYPADAARNVFVMDILQNFVGLAGRYRLGPFARALTIPPACSTLSLWGEASEGGRLRHARNFDFPGIGVWEQRPTIVFCEPDEGLRYGYVTTRGADVPGVTAFNEAGIVVTLHTRFHRDVCFSGAGVVDLGHEIVRRASSIGDAVRIARERPIASSWGVAVSSGRERRAVVLETSARGVHVVEPSEETPYLACANVYEHPEAARGEVVATVTWTAHSRARMNRLRQVAEEARKSGGLSCTDLERLLGDHQTAESPSETSAVGSIVSQPITVKSVVIEPEDARLSVSVGDCPTGWGPYRTVAWSWDGPVGARILGGETKERGDADTGVSVSTSAYRHYLEAVRLDMEGDEEGVLRALGQAVQADPTEPGYRFLLGVLLLREGRASVGLEHLKVGLERERTPYRRGLFLLWMSRAAEEAQKSARAEAFRRRLLQTDHPLLAEHRKRVEEETDRPFPSHRLKHVRVDLLLVDATAA